MKDLGRIQMHMNDDWFSKGLHMVLRNGEKARFWVDPWLPTTPLMQSFPRLYACCMNKNIRVGEAGSWVIGSWVWNFPWRRRLFAWEKDLVEALRVSVLNSFHGLAGSDHWFWRHERHGAFSVKSAYIQLLSLQPPLRADLFNQIWNNLVPKKVAGFAWKLILNRIPTKSAS
ncbi:hypothetical protein RIF29_23336 [Crotalaria pallida]|uniref:Reverse transcriptase zinc-binding domain-containing protein n=1 Tax=Crotalaria pallida TaxID=3830 RepID=A0AAN9FAM5_CROPI